MKVKRTKKLSQITFAASVGAGAFVSPNPSASASEQNTGDLVNQAMKSAEALKPFYSSERLSTSAEFISKYNAAKKEKLKADAAVKKVSGAAKKTK